MFAKGTKILVHEPDHYVPVEELSIGDILINPITGGDVDIVDIKVQTLLIPSITIAPGHPSLAGLFEDLKICTNQIVITCEKTESQKYTVIQEHKANQLLEKELIEKCNNGEYEAYYSISLNRGSLLCANGALCVTSANASNNRQNKSALGSLYTWFETHETVSLLFND
ncbi:hypothetical protein [Roseovarius sp. EL26]|uniref:hypothetical protein n=1 Tax=Roseovarius sp. EL26 TaxID=2126672 RepID=UPI000EA0ACB6|nr:hypothetical protein [Roseovarius sp. EL26]